MGEIDRRELEDLAREMRLMAGSPHELLSVYAQHWAQRLEQALRLPAKEKKDEAL